METLETTSNTIVSKHKWEIQMNMYVHFWKCKSNYLYAINKDRILNLILPHINIPLSTPICRQYYKLIVLQFLLLIKSKGLRDNLGIKQQVQNGDMGIRALSPRSLLQVNKKINRITTTTLIASHIPPFAELSLTTGQKYAKQNKMCRTIEPNIQIDNMKNRGTISVYG